MFHKFFLYCVAMFRKCFGVINYFCGAKILITFVTLFHVNTSYFATKFLQHNYSVIKNFRFLLMPISSVQEGIYST